MSGDPSHLCGWCGDDSRRSFVLELRRNHSLTRCGGCGAVALWPPPDDEELAEAYAPHYYGEGNRRFISVIERAVHWLHARRARDIDRRVRRRWVAQGRPSPKLDEARPSVLDIGCGRGLLLSSLQSLGWEVRGVELHATAAHHAREILRLRVEVGDVERLDLADSSFDCIVLWHVLEHLRSPGAVLSRARRWLRPGGQLVLAVPNLDSWQARLGGRDWFHLDPPRHLHHCEAGRLATWLQKTGFEGIEGRHYCFEQNPYGWLQTIENRLGLPHDHLYRLLKRSSAQPFRNGESRLGSALLAMLLAVPIAPLAFLLSAFEAAARRGGTVTIFAVRAADREGDGENQGALAGAPAATPTAPPLER